MTQSIVQINEQGRLVIPAQLRQQLGLVAGAKLVARIERGRLILEKPEEVIKRLRTTFNSADSLVDELITERRVEANHE
jgi:AbrB family looped-hinge helix DNA binding protein